MRSTWSQLIEYINLNPRYIKRSEMCIEGRKGTIYTYLNYFYQAGLLNKIKPGIYYRVIVIPNYLTLNDVLEIAYKDKNKLLVLMRK